MPQKIEGRVAELLEAKNLAQVATTRENGSPHVTPVWIDHDGEHILINTVEGRDWPANARRTGQVAINVLNHENPYEYVYVQGTLVQDSEDDDENLDVHAHLDKLAKKYMDLDEYPWHKDDEQRVILKIAPDKVIHNNPQ